MTYLKRSRRLQAGLAGLSIVSALGAAVGLGLTTETSSATAGLARNSQSPAQTTSSHRGDEGDQGDEGDEGDDNNHAASTTTSPTSKQQSSPVTQPTTTTTPQATTSGS